MRERQIEGGEWVPLVGIYPFAMVGPTLIGAFLWTRVHATVSILNLN